LHWVLSWLGEDTGSDRLVPKPGDKAMSGNFDFDVIVIGSGFGGSVAALRATEKGYRVGVMESGKRWNDEGLRKVCPTPRSAVSPRPCTTR
jgi:hypothetical protein